MVHRNFYKAWLITFIIAAGFVALNSRTFSGPLQDVSYRLSGMVSVIAGSNGVPSSAYIKNFLNISRISKENLRLERQNNELLGRLAEFKKVKRENERLRSQLNLGTPHGYSLFSVKVIDVQNSPAVSVIIIDKGKRSGIKKNMPVIAGGNILAGIVEEVFYTTSKVILPDDPRFIINARIENGSGIIAQAKGDKNGMLKIDLVTQEEKVREGDMVSTGGFGDVPEGLAIAEVSSAKMNNDGLFQDIRANMIFDLSLGPELFVLK